MITPIFWIIPVASILALVFAWFFFRQMMKEYAKGLCHT